MLHDPRYAWVRQLAAFTVLLAVWEAAGRAGMLNPLYAPMPSRVGAALAELFSDGRIWPHLEATFTAALGGLALGIAAGVLLGVAAALVRIFAELLEPVMTVLNAVPRVILAPLFVIWLGVGLASKVALSFILVAVLVFFTVFTGIRQVDRRLVERVLTLGGDRWALVRHVYLPSVASWVLGSLKVAVGFGLYRRSGRRVRGGQPRPRLSAVVRPEHLQRGPDVRPDPADPGGGAGDLRRRRQAEAPSAALELSAAPPRLAGGLRRKRGLGYLAAKRCGGACTTGAAAARISAGSRERGG
jgi:NitT/TauT family transport system permease protein